MIKAYLLVRRREQTSLRSQVPLLFFLLACMVFIGPFIWNMAHSNFLAVAILNGWIPKFNTIPALVLIASLLVLPGALVMQRKLGWLSYQELKNVYFCFKKDRSMNTIRIVCPGESRREADIMSPAETGLMTKEKASRKRIMRRLGCLIWIYNPASAKAISLYLSGLALLYANNFLQLNYLNLALSLICYLIMFIGAIKWYLAAYELL